MAGGWGRSSRRTLQPRSTRVYEWFLLSGKLEQGGLWTKAPWSAPGSGALRLLNCPPMVPAPAERAWRHLLPLAVPAVAYCLTMKYGSEPAALVRI